MQLLLPRLMPKMTLNSPKNIQPFTVISFSVVKPCHWHLGSHQQLNHFKAEMSLFVGFFGTFRLHSVQEIK